jgi:hypothetical protein
LSAEADARPDTEQSAKIPPESEPIREISGRLRGQGSQDVLSEQSQFDRELVALRAANARVYADKCTPWKTK